MVVAIDLRSARRLVFGLVLGQAIVTLAVALVCFLITGSKGALSALLGGGISTLATLVMALLSFGSGTGVDAQRAIRAFYVGEALKVMLVVASFVIVLKSMKVSPGAMFAAYVATFFVYWIALANALPPLGGKPGPRAERD
jgi:ATP synthase protein I